MVFRDVTMQPGKMILESGCLITLNSYPYKGAVFDVLAVSPLFLPLVTALRRLRWLSPSRPVAQMGHPSSHSAQFTHYSALIFIHGP